MKFYHLIWATNSFELIHKEFLTLDSAVSYLNVFFPKADAVSDPVLLYGEQIELDYIPPKPSPDRGTWGLKR